MAQGSLPPLCIELRSLKLNLKSSVLFQTREADGLGIFDLPGSP